MSLFDKAKSQASSAVTSLFGSNTIAGAYQTEVAKPGYGTKEWKINSQNWYIGLPYRFSVLYPSSDSLSVDYLANKSQYDLMRKFHFALPIPPQVLAIKPVSASAATATMGGVVEEVSPIKFWTINMTGTTGLAVTRGDNDQELRENPAQKFRTVLSTSGIFDGVLGEVQQFANKVGSLVDQGIDIYESIQEGDYGSAFKASAGFLNTTLTPNLPYGSSSIDGDSNGFTEAQALQKFFYFYDALKAQSPKKYMLRFTNYKTNQSWRCQVRDFSLQQSAANPFLFRYSINLQCWDLISADSLEKGSSLFDRFGAGGDLAGVNTALSSNASNLINGLF